MLVAVSDLHFVDGSAGNHNVNYRAFESVFLSEIAGLVKKKCVTNVGLVLNGDVFDLIRTEQWFLERPCDRPWGQNGLADIESPRPGSPTEKRCLKILGKMPFDPEGGESESPNNEEKNKVDKCTILYRNWETFKLFRQFESRLNDQLAKDPGYAGPPQVKVEIFYLPGNHDRLVNLYPSLRDEVTRILGLGPKCRDKDGWYPYEFTAPTYGVFIRHGHQHSSLNFQGKGVSRQDHLGVPVGDVITTEVVVKIPYEVNRTLRTPEAKRVLRKDESRRELVEEKTSKLVENLKEADNVRPLRSAVEWLKFRIGQEESKNAVRLINEAVDSVFADLARIDIPVSPRGWSRLVTGTCRFLLKPLSALLPRRFLGLLMRLLIVPFIVGWFETRQDPYNDKYAEAAFKTWKGGNEGRFIVFGHTHRPVVVVLDGKDEGREAFYVNTGLWRDRIHRTTKHDKTHEFVKMKHMTYAVFYGKNEDTDGKKEGTPSFEVWNGSKHKEYRRAESRDLGDCVRA